MRFLPLATPAVAVVATVATGTIAVRYSQQATVAAALAVVVAAAVALAPALQHLDLALPVLDLEVGYPDWDCSNFPNYPSFANLMKL